LTYIRDTRCINASQGLMLFAQDNSGWYRIGRIPTPSADPNQ